MTYDLVCERKAPDLKVTGPADLVPLLKRFAAKKQEHFLTITLDGNQQVIRIHIVSIGLLNRTLIHPREVFIRAIKDSAASLILAHNHPSGSVEPSREDREATTRLCEAGKLLGIEVLDHLIIGKARFHSFRESGEMPILPSKT
jgi:DNA repair protein RadC